MSSMFRLLLLLTTAQTIVAKKFEWKQENFECVDPDGVDDDFKINGVTSLQDTVEKCKV